ncbi:hypothetical protein SESBI_12509 [Sesbania bispinosa]|nr:hypothetical protein SESBI_12509 [Sesbania bispinosa]
MPNNMVNPSGDDAGNAELHGDWLNVTRKRRGKTVNKTGSNHGRENIFYHAGNSFVVLGGAVNDGTTHNTWSIVTVPSKPVQGRQPKLGERKKRPRVGASSNLDISKLLDNATRALLWAQPVWGLRGIPTSKKSEQPPHLFNIRLAMNVEVLGPNHLRLLDEVEPPDRQMQSSQETLSGQVDVLGDIRTDGLMSNMNACQSREDVKAANASALNRVTGNSDFDMG